MLKDRKINVNITNRNRNYYNKLGYSIESNNLLVKIEDLPKNSHLVVEVICDKCKKEYQLTYAKYNQNISHYGFFTCKKCSNEKKKITNLNKFGVDNYAKKINYGDEVKKIKEEKYGDSNYNNKNKYTETMMNRYGVKYFLESKNFKNKYRKKRDFNYKKNLIKKLKDRGVIDIDNNSNYLMMCEKGHLFKIDSMTLKNRTRKNKETILCTICNPIGSYSQSGQEIELRRFIENNYNGEILLNYKINGKEFDIFLPNLKLAFEYNGLWWHNELYKSKNYHKEKTELCEKNDIRLIQIYEDDWVFKKEIVKSRVLNLLYKPLKKIYARKCEIKEIADNKIIKEFLNNNHIQGFIGSKIKIGLFYNNELISLMTFGNLRKSMGQKKLEGSYEMLRFCNKLNINVIGGASKLFKYFIRNYNPIEVVSYADRSWSGGKLYEKLGFQFLHKTDPNYYYVIEGKRRHRFGFRKDKLIKDGADKNKTEHEIMLEKKIFRIYDSGSLKYIFKQTNKN